MTIRVGDLVYFGAQTSQNLILSAFESPEPESEFYKSKLVFAYVA